jgi:hypothetical protein
LKDIVQEVEIITSVWPVIIQYARPVHEAAKPIMNGKAGYKSVDLDRKISMIEGIADTFIT